MKRLVIVKFTLVLLVFILNFDLIVLGQRKSSTRTTPAKKASNLSIEQILSNEANQQAQAYWENVLTKCGDSYFWKNYYQLSSIEIYEGKGELKIYGGGEYKPPRRLTRADELNNVDPQPVEFMGSAFIEFEVARKFKGYCVLDACSWKNNYRNWVGLSKVKGKWYINPGDRKNASIECEDLNSSTNQQRRNSTQQRNDPTREQLGSDSTNTNRTDSGAFLVTILKQRKQVGRFNQISAKSLVAKDYFPLGDNAAQVEYSDGSEYVYLTVGKFSSLNAAKKNFRDQIASIKSGGGKVTYENTAADGTISAIYNNKGYYFAEYCNTNALCNRIHSDNQAALKSFFENYAK